MKSTGPTARRLWTSTLVTVLVVAGPKGTISAQQPDAAGLGLGGGMMIRNLRASGQPVAPIFDGWYFEPDSTISLCFGYHSLNLDQDVDVPLGPENFLEPPDLDGLQPTHFDEVPPGYRRRFCVFTANVRDAQAADSVVWTLASAGVSLAARATGSIYYRIDEPDQLSRSVHAPRVEILEPVVRAAVRGRSNRVESGRGFRARVGERVPLVASVTPSPGLPAELTLKLLWTLHQGPAPVAIEDEDVEVSGEGEVRHATAASFSEPGEYVLRLQAVDWQDGNSFGFHCCFTNAYVRVSVRE